MRAHSGEAFAELYRVHADRVYTHLFQRIRCRADAEDLTSEVFVTAWQRRDAVRLHPEAGILPWLLVCANYLLKSRRRSIARAQRLLATIPVLAEPDVALSVVEDAEDEWNLRLLSQILAELRPADQDIIQLCVVQGFRRRRSPTRRARL